MTAALLPRVLVVEDEESFVDALTVNLEREGFFVTVARDGVEALERFAADQPDLVLLDVMLPRLSGIDVCRAIRANSTVPIIMVTAKATELDTVVGLEVGADDYVAKPYRVHELVSRMRAVLRRAAGTHAGTNRGSNPSVPPAAAPSYFGGAERGAAESVEHAGSMRYWPGDVTERDGERAPSAAALRPDEILQVGNVVLDLGRHECIVRGEEVKLPLKEFELLEMLLSNPGQRRDARHLDRPGLGNGLRGGHQDTRRAHKAAQVADRARSLQAGSHHDHSRSRLQVRVPAALILLQRPAVRRPHPNCETCTDPR